MSKIRRQGVYLAFFLSNDVGSAEGGRLTALRYAYSPLLKKLYYWALCLCGLSLLILLRIRVSDAFEFDSLVEVIKLILAGSIPISIGVRLLFWVRPRIFSEFQLVPEGLKIYRGKNESEIQFDQIQRISISNFSPRFFGGFTLHLKSGYKLTILSALKNSHEILQAILKSHGELVDSTRAQKYMRMSQLVEISWQRLMNYFAQWKVLVGKILLPIILAYILLEVMNFITVGAVMVFAILLEMILNSLSETLVLSKIQISGTQIERDLKFEDFIFWAGTSGYILLIVLGVYLLSQAGVFL